MEVTLRRANDRVHLQAINSEGNIVDIDGAPRIGGQGAGFRPMQLVLAAVASCASMDLLGILEKQKQRVEKYSIYATGEREERETVTPFKSINLHFELIGDLDEAKCRKAIELALYRYCSVGAMLQETVQIDYALTITKPQYKVGGR